jgi:hypothetical protein
MILILEEPGTEAAGTAIAKALSGEYHVASDPQIVPAGAVWDRKVEWDDLLVVPFQSRTLSDASVRYIEAYRRAHKTGGPIIPVSTSGAFRRPPAPISGIKAANYDGPPDAARIVTAAGVFLGLALRPGSQRIFVSYRATDGSPLANAIYKRLEADGFQPWLDKAKDNLAIGTDVQDTIRLSMEPVAMVLLVDTPDAPDSKWVSIEIDMANGQLIPVLPVVAGGERSPRFVQLQGLRRWALVDNGLGGSPLSDDEWAGVRAQIDELLLSTFRRRLRIISRATEVFAAHSYRWEPVDERLRMYLADKKAKLLLTVVLSHCLVHDITYVPALEAYGKYLDGYKNLAAVNQKLCIYDRDKVLSQTEMDKLSEKLPGKNVILAHYNELDVLLASHFEELRHDG